MLQAKELADADADDVQRANVDYRHGRLTRPVIERIEDIWTRNCR